ncbi:MAG: multicopper oxidase family protein [Alphaproteobacteria bacterium]
MSLSRRHFLQFSALASTTLTTPWLSWAMAPKKLNYTLTATALDNGYFAYKGVDSEAIFLNKNDMLAVNFKNNLPKQSSSIHWHGLRVPNAMDGVPFVTQPPVISGGYFHYEFPIRDSGTYFYHPHFNSAEQVERGLKGIIVVKEDNPPIVDKEHILVLDDILLDEQGNPVADFNNEHDAYHGGRLGNTFRLNGKAETKIDVLYGQRLRLRLICATNARIFKLGFNTDNAWLIAKDGQSVGKPVALKEQQILFGSGQRLDIIFDIPQDGTKDSYSIDLIGAKSKASLVQFVAQGKSNSQNTNKAPVELEKNDLPFDISEKKAKVIDATLRGGMMGKVTRKMKSSDAFWSIGNKFMVGEADQNMQPAWVFKQGKNYILRMDNQTFYDHPMHMHGHFFKVLNGDDKGLWMDTVMVPAKQSIDILFRASEIGKWMFHCHILEHAESGMMVFFEVKA